MSLSDLNPSCCRICGDKDFLVDILRDENYHLFDKLKELEGVVNKPAAIESFDEVFKYICRGCEHALEGFFIFRSKVRKMRRKLTRAALSGRIKKPAPGDELVPVILNISKGGKPRKCYQEEIMEEDDTDDFIVEMPEHEIIPASPIDEDMYIEGTLEDDIIVEEEDEVPKEKFIIASKRKINQRTHIPAEPEFIEMKYIEEADSDTEDDVPLAEIQHEAREHFIKKELSSKSKKDTEQEMEMILKQILDKKRSPTQKKMTEPVVKMVENILKKKVVKVELPESGTTVSPPKKKFKVTETSPQTSKIPQGLLPKVPKVILTDIKHKKSTPQTVQQMLKCNICGRNFALRQNYEKHLKLHTTVTINGDYKCSQCDRVYKSRLNWEIHEMTHKKEEDGFDLEMEHLKEKRSAAIKKSMEKLNWRFQDPKMRRIKKDLFLEEKKRRSQQFNKCIFCDKEFKSRGQMRFHQAYTHLNVPSQAECISPS